MWKKPKLWTFWENIRLQSQSKTILLLVAIWWKFKIFLWTPISFRTKKVIWYVLRSSTVSVAIYGKFAKPSKFYKNENFFGKNISFFNNPRKLNVLRSVTDWVDFYRLFLFNKIKCWKFWKFHYFSRIPRQICYFYRFLKYPFFSKNPLIFKKKTNVLRNRVTSVAFYDKFIIFSDFQKFMFFLEKTHLIFFIKITLWTLWELLLFLSHSTNLPLLAVFKTFQFFSRKTHLFFVRKKQILNVLGNFFAAAFYDRFAIFSNF